MTNGEKYKTAEERKKAISLYCAKTCENERTYYCKQCVLEWLELEAEEGLLPCPFCGGEAKLHNSLESWVECTVCHNTTTMSACVSGVIENWNKRVLSTKEEEDIESKVTGVTLLTTKEATSLPQWILACGDWWWLITAGSNQNNVSFVDIDGTIDYFGEVIHSDDNYVRPVLLTTLQSNIKIGTLKTIYDIDWLYIGDGRFLSAEPQFKSRFDEESNDWEKSELKKNVEEWWNTQINKVG